MATAAAVSAGYLNLDGVNDRLRQIAEAYPAIAQVVDLTATYNTPPTFEGRHIFALKISDNVSVDEDEPAMLVAATHHAREIGTPVIAFEAADRLTAGYDVDPRITDAVNGHEILDRPGVESRRLQLRLHHQQPVEEEPPRLLEWRRRRPEPELRAGMGHLLRRQHERRVRDLQGALGRLGAGDPHDDDLVRDRAIRQGHRLPLLRTRSPLRVSMPEPPVHGLDAAGSRRALAWRPVTAATRECPAPKASISSGSSPGSAPMRSSSRRTPSSSRRTPAR